VIGRPPREHRLGWLLCAPAVVAMVVVTAYPILYAAWLSLFRYDLRFPEQRVFAGASNYLSVVGSEIWWQAVLNTVVITVSSVSVELVLGFAFALLMHRSMVGRRGLRTALLIPYGIITVVSAMAWKFAFDPATGFINPLLGVDLAWLGHRVSAFAVIILAEIWKTTPFLALLLLAGLTLVPEDVVRAARVDGASAVQRFFRITLPIVKPAVGVAVLFRTLDAFRIFDVVFIQTRGAQNTETVSIVGYNALIVRLNLGLGSAVSVLVFLAVVVIAAALIRAFDVRLARQEGT
jgi:multiple sugar transport system permease protein